MEEGTTEENYLNNSLSITKNDHMLASSYTIKDFDPNMFNDLSGGVCVIIAPTNSGKTVLLKHILAVIGKNFQNHWMMSDTAGLQAVYDFWPKDQMSNYDEEILKNLWESQKLDPSRKTLLVLDDVIADTTYKGDKSGLLQRVAFQGRHIGLLVILLSQTFSAIKPAIRNNARIAISFALSSKKETEKFVEAFMATVSNRVGYLVFRKITGQKYRAVIVCNYKVGEAFTERVYQFTADPNVKIDFFEKMKKPKKVTKAEIKEQKKQYSSIVYKF